jgi:hypothetical protein
MKNGIDSEHGIAYYDSSVINTNAITIPSPPPSPLPRGEGKGEGSISKDLIRLY